MLRCDRALINMGVTRGGGVLLAVNKDFKAVQLDLQVVRSNLVKIDIVGCKVTVHFTSFYIFVIYIPPYATSIEILSLLIIIILGDFNMSGFQDGVAGD